MHCEILISHLKLGGRYFIYWGIKKSEDSCGRNTNPPSLQVSSIIENLENLSSYSSPSKISEQTEPKTKHCQQMKQKNHSSSHGRSPQNKMSNDLLENIPVPMLYVLLRKSLM